jgi:hypothetical protein
MTYSARYLHHTLRVYVQYVLTYFSIVHGAGLAQAV